MLDQRFNTKPYATVPGASDAAIVHFHGPKPQDYLAFITTGNCSFMWLCEDGFKK